MLLYKHKNMKSTFLRLSVLLLLLASFFFSCSTEELAHPEVPKVVRLMIDGNSTKDLECVYKDSIFTIARNDDSQGRLYLQTLLAVDGKNGELKIREKGATKILQTRVITATPYEQIMNIIYDGEQVYSGIVNYQVKGYAAGELEFLLDDKVVYSGVGVIDNTISIGINQESNRKLTVRKKDETTALTSRTIQATPVIQSLKFFFDGTSMVDNIKLDPPANPANMSLTVKFETILPALFNGGPVDLVFFMRDNNTYATTKVIPEIRVTIPTNGTFSKAIELPPVPVEEGVDYQYTFEVFEPGTTTVPYNTAAVTLQPVRPGNGRFINSPVIFTAGSSKLILINDSQNAVRFPVTQKGTYFGVFITDLTAYFQ
jgi:hypothetical protein